MKLFTAIGINNDNGEIFYKHLMALDANAAAAMAAEEADIKFIALLPGWHDSFLATEGQPREAADLLWSDDDED